jgi:hypothetical protein
MALETRILDETSADNFVQRSKNVRWDGWDIVKFSPNPRAVYSVDGRFDRSSGLWGIEHRFSPGPDGLWRVKVWKHGKRN